MISSRKTALAVATIGAIAASTSGFAVNLSNNGLGDVGLVPYYTVRNGFDTNISVVNTSNKYVVAFKIRFREADNSRDARDFNVFLSPNDVWTATVSMNSNGVPILRTNDQSCTAPIFPLSTNENFKGYREIEFTSLAYDGRGKDSSTDLGWTGIERTYDGHFEIIEMGVADPSNKANQLARAAVHQGASRQPKCAAVANAYLNPVKYDKNGNYELCARRWEREQILNGKSFDDGKAFEIEFCEPLNVLKVAANLVSSEQGVAIEIPVDMLANFYNPTGVEDQKVPHAQDLMYQPGDPSPSLSDVNPPRSNQVTEDGTKSVDFANSIDAVSSLFSTVNVVNEYETGGMLSALTDWVITFPTKNFYVDKMIDPTPFKNIWNGSSCDPVKFTYYNREEQKEVAAAGTLLPSPLPREEVKTDVLCYEAQLLQFGEKMILAEVPAKNDPKGVNFAPVTRVQPSDNPSKFDNGWMRLEFPQAGLISGKDAMDGTTEVTFTGLPVTGFAVTLENQPVTLSDGSIGTAVTATSTRHAYARVIK